jgi:hypothetical protein
VAAEGFVCLCRHGFGKWQAIISDPDPNVGPMLAARTNVDLKVRVCNTWPSHGDLHHVRH